MPLPGPTIVLTQVITPVADSWFEVDVGTGAPVNATPQGSNPRLKAGWSDTGIDEHEVLRFAVPTTASDTHLVRADLELAIEAADIFVFDPPRRVTSGTMLVQLRDIETDWVESSLSSLDPPELGPVWKRTETPWGPCDAGGCGIAQIDLLEHLLARARPGSGPDQGFGLRANGVIDRATFGTIFEVASRESEHPPRLHLAWAAVPFDQPPSSTPTVGGTRTATSTGTPPTATASPTGMASATGTPSAEPSSTPGPEPTWELREVEGLFGTGFEVVSFVEGDSDCPGYGVGWWLDAGGEFWERYEALRAGRSPYPSYENEIYVARARFHARISPPGSYGHLGAYERQVQVVELLEMGDTDHCGMDLPDLALASYRYGRTNALPSGCTPGHPGPATLELCIVNQGRQPAGDAWVDVYHEGELVARRRLCGLAVDETRCLAPVTMPAGDIRIDPEREVDEHFEANNRLMLAVPTFTPPPTCTALPPGRPSPTPQPTATLQACITPPPSPTASTTPTRGPNQILLPFTTRH